MNFDFIELFFKQDSFTEEALMDLKQLVKKNLKSEAERKSALSKISLYLAYFKIGSTDDFNSHGELVNKTNKTPSAKENKSKKRKEVNPKITSSKTKKTKKTKTSIKNNGIDKEIKKIYTNLLEKTPIDRKELISILEIKETRFEVILKNFRIDPKLEVFDTKHLRILSNFLKDHLQFVSRKAKRKKVIENPLIGQTKKSNHIKNKTSVYDKIALNGGVGKIIYTRAKY